MRRILIFSLVYYPRMVGGAEVAVKEITDRILPEEVSFDMITMHTGEASAFERVGNINVHRIGPSWKGKPNSVFFFLLKYLFMPLALLKAFRLHRKNQYDMTWSIMANYASGPALFFKLFHRKVQLLLTLQEGDPFAHIRKRVSITYPFFKKLFRVADHIQAISTYLGDWAVHMGATCPIDIVPNGVDLNLFGETISADRKNDVRTALKLSINDRILITTSRLVRKNAVDDIIASLSFMEKTYKVLIIGAGPDEDMLKAQAAKLQLSDRVLFKGYVPHAELPKYLQMSDVFVRPSRSEGLGNSFLEAMASGIPVVATPVGGIPDFLTDGETGLFCEVNNPRSIALKVEKLIKDRESREYIVGRARALVLEKYEWAGIARRMQDIFEKGAIIH